MTKDPNHERTGGERKPSGFVTRVAQVALRGALVFSAVGLIEAVVLMLVERYPDVLAFLRSAVWSYALFGLAMGLIWGSLCEAAAIRWPGLTRRRTDWLVLSVAALTFVLNVYTQKYIWQAAGPSNLGIPLPLILFIEWIPGLLAIVLVGRRRRRATEVPLRRPRALLLGFGLVLLLLTVAPEIPRSAGGRGVGRAPNVLLIILDTTRLDRMSAYGYDRPTTPAFERVAREGTRFTRAYAAAPWTLPSHASIFTGLSSSVHGATREHMYLDERHPTLAEALTRQGLRTVAITKKEYLWPDTGVMRGFTQHFDFFGLRREPALVEAYKVLKKLAAIQPADGGAEQINRAARRWVRLHDTHPFFMFINYNEPHAPLAPPEPFRTQYLQEDADTAWGREKFPDYAGFSSGRVTYTAQELRIISDLYDAEVAYQDYRLGQLLDELRACGVLDETLVIIASDHGENLGDHDLLGHAHCLYETLVHVPLVVRLPRVIPADRVVDTPVTLRKIWPLVARVLGHGADTGLLDEDALLTVLAEDVADPAAFAAEYRLVPHGGSGARWVNRQHAQFAQRHRARWRDAPRAALSQRRLKCVVAQRYKFLWSSDEKHEFYDLLADPLEQTNLIDTASPDVARMRQRLLDEAILWIEPMTGPGPGFSEEALRKLRSLGYIGSGDSTATDAPPPR